MNTQISNSQITNSAELNELCATIRELIDARKYKECEHLLGEAIGQYPHAPHPHNLYGLMFEAKGEHHLAMSHFRAAWALDTAYKPVQQNLARFGTFRPKEKWAYDESDCPDDKNIDAYLIEYDANGIGRVVKSRPCEIKYDTNGVGRVTRTKEGK